MIFILSLLACYVSIVHAGDVKEGKQTADKKLPIKVTSDMLEAFNDKRLVIFSGNAVAIQGDKIIRADRLLLYYKKAGSRDKAKESQDVEQAGDLERIEAKGHVNVTQGSRIATGEEAVYEQDSQTIIMTGNAVMREGKNVIRGTKITLLMNENRGIVEGQEKKRVTATIYPSENKEGKDSKR
ncbi:MAG: lipopolysaccharide transport periplasmic protein LptA [Syntrophales bacterium]|nr:lipopolysaccharide transport periplasmic protein LptA [Syntrophales bacterium]